MPRDNEITLYFSPSEVVYYVWNLFLDMKMLYRNEYFILTRAGQELYVQAWNLRKLEIDPKLVQITAPIIKLHRDIIYFTTKSVCFVKIIMYCICHCAVMIVLISNTHWDLLLMSLISSNSKIIKICQWVF